MSEPIHAPTRPVTPPSAAGEVRLAYRGFRNTPALREYVVSARLGDEERDYVVAIAQAAFADRRVSLQDGPDICFQRVRRELSGGALADLGPLAISDEELASYRAAHTVVSRRRPRVPPTEAPTQSPQT